MRETSKYIFFWATQDIYSNWYPSRFRMEGHTFANAEQALMYEKAKLMGDETMMVKILKTPNPRAVKALGRQVKPWKQEVWKKHRLPIMTKVCLAKFKANAFLSQTIKATDHKIIVEASPYDTIWGIGMREDDAGVETPKNWKGLNLLGQALMNARGML